jgi:hypothetical protein
MGAVAAKKSKTAERKGKETRKQKHQRRQSPKVKKTSQAPPKKEK